MDAKACGRNKMNSKVLVMAAECKVKRYLAYWLQAGKQLICPLWPNGYPLPSIVQGDRYSPEFEQCWDYASNPASGDCYLTGMKHTIQDLLTEEWEIVGCARCDMPVPMLESGINHDACPCSDLFLWPNLDLPQPRAPIDTNAHLMAIHTRLLAVSIAVNQAKESDAKTFQDCPRHSIET